MVVASARVVVNSAAEFQIMLGTDDVTRWWFLVSLPVAFVLLAARAMENLGQDRARYRSDAPLVEPAVIGADRWAARSSCSRSASRGCSCWACPSSS